MGEAAKAVLAGKCVALNANVRDLKSKEEAEGRTGQGGKCSYLPRIIAMKYAEPLLFMVIKRLKTTKKKKIEKLPSPTTRNLISGLKSRKREK